MTFSGQLVLDLFQKSLGSIRPHTKKRVITEREADILSKLYNFEESTFPTMEEVAEEYSLSRERIRQIHNKALKKMKYEGRRLKEDTPCVQFYQFMNNSILMINRSELKDYIKIGEFWIENLSDFPGRIVARLIANFIYTNKNDIDNCLTGFSTWRRSEFEKEKKIRLDEFRIHKETAKIIQIQDDILSKVIWFETRKKWPDAKRISFIPVRKVSSSSDYNSGIYFSDKCKQDVQYESGLELEFILHLENFPKVKFYVEQPRTIKYKLNNKNYIYTPDFAVFLESGEVFLVEVKDFSGMADARVHRKLEVLIDFCFDRGLGLLLIEKKESIQYILDHKFNVHFRDVLKLKLNENGGRTMFLKEFKAIQETCNAKRIDLLSIVLNENWSLYPIPFKLSTRNPYQKFRKTFVLKNSINSQLAQDQYTN